ncbi:MAG TPA: hypothetical protein VH164_13870, partial [Ktedonobacteraceae bacterium]|nr:hypothetical protein [Ktedonobacteraceae bacterium]
VNTTSRSSITSSLSRKLKEKRTYNQIQRTIISDGKRNLLERDGDACVFITVRLREMGASQQVDKTLSFFKWVTNHHLVVKKFHTEASQAVPLGEFSSIRFC